MSLFATCAMVQSRSLDPKQSLQRVRVGNGTAPLPTVSIVTVNGGTYMENNVVGTAPNYAFSLQKIGWINTRLIAIADPGNPLTTDNPASDSSDAPQQIILNADGTFPGIIAQAQLSLWSNDQPWPNAQGNVNADSNMEIIGPCFGLAFTATSVGTSPFISWFPPANPTVVTLKVAEKFVIAAIGQSSTQVTDAFWFFGLTQASQIPTNSDGSINMSGILNPV